MDVVAQMQETDIPTILGPTFAAFIPLLEPLRSDITQARKTFQYGPTERHQMDVYYPQPTGKKAPLLLFIYGGGFVSGARTLPPPSDLAYGNLALYFAQRGFVVLIPDYRLAPSTTFPGPVEDVRDALSWAVAHPSEMGEDIVDMESVYVLGHSAGGVHALTLLLYEPVLALAPQLRVHIKGAIIASAPSHFPPAPSPADAYYVAPFPAAAYSPLALLKAASEESAASLPPMVLLLCENDPAWFKAVAADFDKAAEAKALKPAHVFAKGHNHISLTLALGTGVGEEWAEEVVAWIKAL